MLSLHADVILKIVESLTDREKIYLASTSKETDKLKFKMRYTGKINMQKRRIRQLPYFNNFEYVKIDITDMALWERIIPRDVYPMYTKHIYLEMYPNRSKHNIQMSTINYYFGNLLIYIPNTVTHLTFGKYFNLGFLFKIPETVTHLTFGTQFDQSITNVIPRSVTHLIFGQNFNQPIKQNDIPDSVTHLTFDFCFNQSIKNNIPASVSHLTFGDLFKHSIFL
jgi:hypothetical protein